MQQIHFNVPEKIFYFQELEYSQKPNYLPGCLHEILYSWKFLEHIIFGNFGNLMKIILPGLLHIYVWRFWSTWNLQGRMSQYQLERRTSHVCFLFSSAGQSFPPRTNFTLFINVVTPYNRCILVSYACCKRIMAATV